MSQLPTFETKIFFLTAGNKCWFESWLKKLNRDSLITKESKKYNSESLEREKVPHMIPAFLLK